MNLKHKLANPTIGDGAGPVVTHDVPPYTVVYRVPAKVVKRRFDSEEKEKLVRENRFWEQGPSEAREILSQIENKSKSCGN